MKKYNCEDCSHYIENDDTGNECQGEAEICNEFDLKKDLSSK